MKVVRNPRRLDGEAPTAPDLPSLSYRDLRMEVRQRRMEELAPGTGMLGSGPGASIGEAVGSCQQLPSDGAAPVRAERTLDRLSQSLDGTSAKAVLNTISALSAFRRANLLAEDDVVGPELLDARGFDRAIAAMAGLDCAPTTVERHQSELMHRIRPWALSARRRAIIELCDFHAVLDALMKSRNIPLKTLSLTTGISYATLYSWTTGGKRDPRSLKSVRQMECALGVEPGTLSALCEFSGRVEISASEVQIDVTPKQLQRVRRFLPLDFADRRPPSRRASTSG
jgi:hypothetical protein